jgi:hypothetical protein
VPHRHSNAPVSSLHSYDITQTETPERTIPGSNRDLTGFTILPVVRIGVGVAGSGKRRAEDLAIRQRKTSATRLVGASPGGRKFPIYNIFEVEQLALCSANCAFIRSYVVLSRLISRLTTYAIVISICSPHHTSTVPHSLLQRMLTTHRKPLGSLVRRTLPRC